MGRRPACLLALLALCARTAGFAVVAPARSLTTLPLRAHAPARRVALRMEEYSTKVKITTETRAPLRQARIFFL